MSSKGQKADEPATKKCGDPSTPRFVRTYVPIFSLRSVVRHGETEAALEILELSAGGSYAQFYRVFREQTGRSPSALRTAAARAA